EEPRDHNTPRRHTTDPDHKEKTHRQHHDDKAHKRPGDPADDSTTMMCAPARNLSHRRKQNALRTESTGVEAGRDAMNPREIRRDVDPLDHLLCLTGLQLLHDHILLLAHTHT